MRRRDVVLDRLALGLDGRRFLPGLRICRARGRRRWRFGGGRIVCRLRCGRCGFVLRYVRSGVARHRFTMPLATAATPMAAAATTTPAPAPAVVAVAGLSATFVTGLRLGTERGGALIRVWLRRLVVADLFVAAAGDITRLAGQ